MSILNHLGQAAAMLLLLELLVLVVLFAGIAGGLAFGTRWLRGRTGWASEKALTYLKIGSRYVEKGSGIAALPFIRASGFAEAVKGTIAAIERRVRSSPSP